ncbi:MAG: hypothetical protein J6C53_00230 [Clostridia bacterium]|nr:hypothetical protein [Clostridia bacterium]
MTKFKDNSKCLKLSAVLLFPMALFGGISLSQAPLAKKAEALSYATSHNEEVELENDSFQNGRTPYASGTLSSWSAIESESRATGMIIDVGSGQMSEGENGETATFSKYKDTYMLLSNPECKDTSDTRVLMINSKASNEQHNIDAKKGYRSTSVKLAKNSYYSFKVSALAMLNGDEYVNGSIYISGLVDLDGKAMQVGMENISPSSWTDYYFFIATGDSEQTVTIDLYLGSANGAKSQGAVFFDDCHIERYSENLFYDLATKHGYDFTDNHTSFENDTVFLVNGLKTIKNFIAGHDGYNFDFEDGLNGWETISQANGYAKALSLNGMQASDFKANTGFDFVGNDLSYENDKSLVLYTTSNAGYTNHIGVKSGDIEIKAHTAYKVSMKMKVSGMEEGSFYLKVTENDSIYSLYPTIFSGDEDSDIYYGLKSEKTSGYTSNTDNDWVNDFQTIEFFVRGYDLYNTSVNLELWLGDTSTNAYGCVVVDNIEVEIATTEEFSSATDKLELKAYTGTSSGFSNPYFNSTEYSDVKEMHPFVAKEWTTSIEKEEYNESGVVYIGADDEYKSMYSGKYDWAGISPKMNGSSVTNNVYMMFNRQNSYQSLTSSTYGLANDAYYKISFDYYNQLFGSLNPSSIKIEIVDENGITLFSQDGISSLDEWDNMEIYLHTAHMVTHDIQVVVHLGENEEGKKVGGLVYLDNFAIEETDKDAFIAGKYNADFADYFLSLETNGKISNELSSSPAFDFVVDEVYDNGYQGNEAGAEGGIVNGQNNPYGVTTDTSNFLVLSTKVASKASLTSKFNFKFTADSYYKLTFDLATIFNDGAKDAGTDEHDCGYGVSISMEGFDEIANIVTDGTLKTYTIYFKCDSDVEANFIFSLISDCDETTGTALLTNLNIEASNSDEYASANLLPTYNQTTFTTEQSDVVEEEPEPDEPTKEGNDSAWLLIPSIIMGLALIIAIIGFAMRKIKIKKINKLKKENYDRKLSLDHDVVMAEARKRRDKEVADLQNARKMLENDKAELEAKHKEFVRESRASSNGKLTREIEKAFKKYNSSIARINEKINIIKEKIDNVMSAEYLLSIENKIVMEEEAKFSAEKKIAKEQFKAEQKNSLDE